MTLPVSEVFQSFQGEGPRAGRVVVFIRLGGCNLSCSWCDTPYTWDSTRHNLREELTPMSPDDIVARVREYGADEVVISGGEPLMHQNTIHWANLLRGLHRAGKFICVETNGTLVPNETTTTFVRHYSISPKLANSGPHKKNQSPTVGPWLPTLRLGGFTCLKFVVANAAEVAEAVAKGDELGWQRDAMWMMPLGTDTESLLANWTEICDAAIKEGVNVTQRLHVLAYGDTRGT